MVQAQQQNSAGSQAEEIKDYTLHVVQMALKLIGQEPRSTQSECEELLFQQIEMQKMSTEQVS